MARIRRPWQVATAFGLSALVVLAATPPVGADPVTTGSASAFAVEISTIEGGLVGPVPVAESPSPAPGEVSETELTIPAAPLAVSGTFIARSAVHETSDLPTELEQSEQEAAGPYNARGIGQIEELQALIDEEIPGGALIAADALRAEAVAVCSGGVVTYGAQSEVVNLQIAGDDSLSGPLNDLVDQIAAGLNGSPLAQVATIEVNVVEVTATGASVDALVLKLFPEASENDPRAADFNTSEQQEEPRIEAQQVEAQQEEEPVPFLEARFGHAEVANVTCAPPPVTEPTVLSNTPLPRTQHPPTGGPNLFGIAAVVGTGGLALYALRRRIA